MKCSECAFWKRDELRGGETFTSSGTCRRYAPRPEIMVKDGRARELVWPGMNANEACGEIIPRDVVVLEKKLNEADQS